MHRTSKDKELVQPKSGVINAINHFFEGIQVKTPHHNTSFSFDNTVSVEKFPRSLTHESRDSTALR